MTDKNEPKRPRGRPPKPIPKLDVIPEKVARAMFAAVKSPDPSLRKGGCAALEQPDGRFILKSVNAAVPQGLAK